MDGGWPKPAGSGRDAQPASGGGAPAREDLIVTQGSPATHSPLSQVPPHPSEAVTLAPGPGSGDSGASSVNERMTSAGFPGAGHDSLGDSLGEGGGEAGPPRIDGYDLTRMLGRGGMGVVYEGTQQATGRRVAVKFMLNSAVASEAARKRFEREVDVVAGLSHPGIVSIIDSGVRRGRYFYVMEYVDGRPLDEASPPGRSDPRDALRLIAQVCDAIDYAHQRGVLHRDLKPSNVLVDAGGSPHLLDFGLAKRVEVGGGAPGALNLTMSEPGQLLGTVAYMSPEQAGGRHDETSVRTDVYSLGVIAYELVCGGPPVPMEGSLREILTGIAERDPAPPSTRRARLSRDIDAVLLKALEKLPQNRYATAGELAADIRRCLADEPVLARRTGPAGRAWRWVRRNRAISAVAAAALITLAVTSGVLVRRIVLERDRANANAENTQKALTQSRQNERYANDNFVLLRSILESTDPDQQGEITVRQLLDNATAALDASPPELDLTEASVRETLGSVYRKFGDYAKARQNLARALAIREAHATGDDHLLADCLHNLAAAMWWQGDYAGAEKLYVRAMEMRRRLIPGDHRDIAMSMTHLAACRMRLGMWEDARRLYSDALDMRRRLFGPEHEEVAQSLNNLAKSYMEAGEFPKAEGLFREALAMITRLRGENSGGAAAATQNLAVCLLEKGDASGARDAFAHAAAIRATLFPKGHHLTAASLVGQAQAELALDRVEAAESLVREGMEMHERMGRSGHPDYADALGVLGEALLRSGRAAEAETRLRRAVEIASAVSPPSLEQLAQLRGLLGWALLRTGKSGESIGPLEESFRDVTRLRAGHGRHVAQAAGRLADAYEASGRAGDAARLRGIARSAEGVKPVSADGAR